MSEKRIKEMDLNSVLLEFRIEAAGAPNPAVLDAYCRKYPQYARELAGYAVQWLIGDALAATAPTNEVAYSAGSSPLVSRAISRFHDRLQTSAEEGGARTGGKAMRNPFEGLAIARKRQIRDELGLDQGLFAKFQNRLIEADTVPRRLGERFARLVGTTPEGFLAHLQGPPAMHAAPEFKAHQKPSVSAGKETFDEAVRKSSLDEKKKQALLKG
jgi:hypothetical protein